MAGATNTLRTSSTDDAHTSIRDEITVNNMDIDSKLNQFNESDYNIYVTSDPIVISGNVFFAGNPRNDCC